MPGSSICWTVELVGSQCYCILLYIFVYCIYTIWCLINSVRSKQCAVCVLAVFFKSSGFKSSVSLFTFICTILSSRPSYKICICFGGQIFKGVILGFLYIYCIIYVFVLLSFRCFQMCSVKWSKWECECYFLNSSVKWSKWVLLTQMFTSFVEFNPLLSSILC